MFKSSFFSWVLINYLMSSELDEISGLLGSAHNWEGRHRLAATAPTSMAESSRADCYGDITNCLLLAEKGNKDSLV